MKCEMYKRYYRNMLKSRSVLAALAILFAYALIDFLSRNAPCYMGLLRLYGKNTDMLFNYNYWSFFHYNPVTLITISLYALYSQYSRTFFQKESVIIRFDDHYSYWKRRITCLLIDTTIFVLFIHILLIIRLLLLSGTRIFIKNALSYLVVLPLNIIGLLFIGLIFQFVYSITGKSAISFFSAYIFVIYDFAANQIGWPNIFVDKAFCFQTERLFNEHIQFMRHVNCT